MKCIFCLDEKPPSDEHVIPESVGGTLRIQEVCRDCNSKLGQLVDNPFSNSFLVQLARFSHSLGGKRGAVPFPFGGMGTLDTGQRVSLDRDFVPHVKRVLDIQKGTDDQLVVNFTADASDKDKLEQMLGKPLRKAMAVEFPTWTSEKMDEEVAKVMAYARAYTPVLEDRPIGKQWKIGLDDLLLEFLKIAYEIWFRAFGYPWVENSATARNIRAVVLGRGLSVGIGGQLFCPPLPLPLSNPSTNHCIVLLNGACVIRLFNFCCTVECEETDSRFMVKQEAARIILQDFRAGTLVEEMLPDFLAKHLPEA
ncbi:MAG: HNH endonuclease [Nitrospira sp.]|nr:HNH endonuclease [Nitrospira sp.]